MRSENGSKATRKTRRSNDQTWKDEAIVADSSSQASASNKTRTKHSRVVVPYGLPRRELFLCSARPGDVPGSNALKELSLNSCTCRLGRLGSGSHPRTINVVFPTPASQNGDSGPAADPLLFLVSQRGSPGECFEASQGSEARSRARLAGAAWCHRKYLGMQMLCAKFPHQGR